MDAKSPSIAIVGSGPSGCYAAQFLRKKWPVSEIVIFEALPVPYGLVRYGVAPDHQGNKSVTEQFDRLFEREGIQFAGNVTIGKDIPFDDLRGTFDIVILATGLDSDRSLQLEGAAEHCPVIGAGALLKALNGHPLFDGPKDSNGLPRQIGNRVAVVGNGNVAMDVVRLLAKRNEHLDGSDVADSRLVRLRTERITHIDVIGRSPAGSAKFDLSMLKEIVSLPHVQVSATGLCDDAGDAVVKVFLGLPAAGSSESDAGAITVAFHFCACPVGVRRENSAARLTIEQGDAAERRELKVDSIVAAIGFEKKRTSAEEEWCGPNVFKVGWLNSGGRGAIAANRRDAREVTDAIVRAVEAGELSTGTGKKISDLAQSVAGHSVPFEGWLKINCWEIANATERRCRQKILQVPQMIDVATS